MLTVLTVSTKEKIKYCCLLSSHAGFHLVFPLGNEIPDSMAKHSESTLFSPSALSSHPWNPSPTSQTPGFLFTSPPSPSAGPLVPHLPPGFHSFVPTTDSGPPSVVHRKCLQVLNDSGGNEGKWPLNLVLEENPKNISKLSFFLTER